MFTKKPPEIIPEENTSVWNCTSEDCIGWMRDNFSFDITPACPLCSSEMTNEEKVLPILLNNNNYK